MEQERVKVAELESYLRSAVRAWKRPEKRPAPASSV
jgi:hypothetical protein